MHAWRRGMVALMITAVLAGTTFGADAAIVRSKLRAKFSAKKITVKGKVDASGDWPVGLRLELIDAQENVIASASDSMRGTGSFQMELPAPRGQKFVREELANARVRYWVRRGKREEEVGSVELMEFCPKLIKKKRWWW